jgi:hypothetical protein
MFEYLCPSKAGLNKQGFENQTSPKFEYLHPYFKKIY